MSNPEKLSKIIKFFNDHDFKSDVEAYHRMSTISWLLEDESQCADPRLPLKQLIQCGADPSRRMRYEMDGMLPERNGDNAKWTRNEEVKRDVLNMLQEERKKRRLERKRSDKNLIKGRLKKTNNVLV